MKQAEPGKLRKRPAWTADAPCGHRAPARGRWLLIFSVASLVGGVGRGDNGGWFRPSRHEQPHPAVARIVVEEQGAMSLGSGTLVAAHGDLGLVVTNWHVVRDAGGLIHVVFPGGFRSGARILKVDADWDLAALLIWRPEAQPVAIAERPPRPGDMLTIAGYGGGAYRTASGRCTQYLAPSHQHPYELVELAAAARQGDSGGPILNDHGQLAGVLFGSSGRTTSGSFAPRVSQFLSSVWPLPDAVTLDPSRIARLPAPAGQGQPPRAAGLPAAPPEPLDDPATGARGPLLAGNRPRAAGAAQRARVDGDGQQADESLVPLPWAEAAPQPRRPIASTPAPERVAGAQSGGARPTEPATLTWRDLAGGSAGEQLKTLLALIGVGAIFLQISRWLSPARR